MREVFRKYPECGIFDHGFARTRCADCGHNFFVAFTCKGSGVCLVMLWSHNNIRYTDILGRMVCYAKTVKNCWGGKSLMYCQDSVDLGFGHKLPPCFSSLLIAPYAVCISVSATLRIQIQLSQ